MSMYSSMTRLFLLLGALFLASATSAQNMFAPVITINGGVVTQYELDQRIAFLRVLRAPGDLTKAAEEALINERVQVIAAKRAGISVSKEELSEGLKEFAARANLEVEPFVNVIGDAGVSPETFRDFVENGLLWRKFVRERFAARTTVTEAEIDRELASQDTQTGARVSLSEIVLPADPARIADSTALAAQLKATIRTRDQFAQAAARFSMSPSRMQGGRIGTLDLNELPAQLIPILLTLRPGELSEPVPVGENAIAVFQLRDLTELPARPSGDLTVDYLQYAIPGGNTPQAKAEARQVLANVQSCDDFYPIVRGVQEERLSRISQTLRQVPSHIALTLAKLDKNEASTELTANDGQTLLLTMLCSRTPVLDENARETARLAVFNNRLTSLADGYLEALKADAIVRRP